QLVQFVRREERRAGHVDLLPERAIEFAGVPAAFVDLQTQLRRADDDVELSLRTLVRRQERHRLFGDALRVARQVPLLDHLPAGQLVLPAERIRPGARLPVVLAGGVSDNAAARPDEGLLDAAAFAVGEVLLLADEGHLALCERDAFYRLHDPG